MDWHRHNNILVKSDCCANKYKFLFGLLLRNWNYGDASFIT